MFPTLRRLNAKIYACDIALTVARDLTQKLEWHGIEWVCGIDGLTELDSGTFDTIICLDVLEHDVGSLHGVTREFMRLLSDGGRLVVSGPTESRLYRLGRWFAGFSGEYHVRTIYEIEKHFSNLFDLKSVKKLIWPVTLFRISVWKH
jgi:2-polyprenyl-3-methyl-5-hydroxy-6-metoxy-1,4-benzoquinol methylase